MTPELYGTVVILVVLVALSAFFSASETAFTSANRVKLKTMAQGGNKRAQIALNCAVEEAAGKAVQARAHGKLC